jgi:hypothetical protein
LARVFAWLAVAGFNPSTGEGEFGIDVACGIQAEVSDFYEGARQDVKKESAHEFQGFTGRLGVIRSGRRV